MYKVRKIIHILYKSLWSIGFIFKGFIHNISFRLLLWFNNVQFGKGVMVGGGNMPMLRISPNAKKVTIGNNVSFNNNDGPAWYSSCAICVRAGGELHVGDNSGLNGSLLFCSNAITIGKNVKIGGGTRVFDTDFHPLDFKQRRLTIEGSRSSPVVIDDDVFVGTNCIIGKGIHIGSRSIVAAGSVVTVDIPADEVWGGNPAKLIRKNLSNQKEH